MSVSRSRSSPYNKNCSHVTTSPAMFTEHIGSQIALKREDCWTGTNTFHLSIRQRTSSEWSLVSKRSPTQSLKRSRHLSLLWPILNPQEGLLSGRKLSGKACYRKELLSRCATTGRWMKSEVLRTTWGPQSMIKLDSATQSRKFRRSESLVGSQTWKRGFWSRPDRQFLKFNTVVQTFSKV